MRLLINTATTHKGGSVQVARSFISECRKFPMHEYIVVLGINLAEQIEPETFPSNFKFIKIPYRPATKVKSLFYQDSFLKDVEARETPDAVFTTSGPSYWRSGVPHLMGYNLPHYVYPDSPFFSTISWTKRIKWKLKGWLIGVYFRRDADHLVVQTEDVAVRATKWLGIPSSVVSNTCSDVYLNHQDKDVPGEKYFKSDGTYRLLTLSGYYPHKHLEIIEDLVRIFRDNKVEDIRFVLTLPDEEFKAHFSPEARKYIANVGPVNATDAPDLYSDCQAMFLPSLLECFSASYPEAMVMKKPIITTDMSFAKSICDDAAEYFKSMDAGDAFSSIMKVKENAAYRGELVRNGLERLKVFLSPEQRAGAYLELLKKIKLEAAHTK